VDVNAQYVGFEYHYTYLVFCGFIVWLIIPGIGLLYGGLARRKSALALLFQSLMVAAVTTFQWMFWGYSLAYSRTAGPFIGDLANFGMKNVMAAPSPGSAVIPEIVFCLYQLLFWYVFRTQIVAQVLIFFEVLAQSKSWLEAPSREVVLFHRWSSVFSGPPSSTAPLLAGHGTPMDGCISFHPSISLEVDLFTSLQAGLRSHMPSFSGSASTLAISHMASPTTPLWSFWVQCSSGSGGSGSMVDLL
jgi:hypothetical protein